MNKTKGTYHPEGLPAKLLRYFENYPDAELTREQITLIFSASRANVSMVYKKLSDEGLLESVNVIRRTRKAQK